MPKRIISFSFAANLIALSLLILSSCDDLGVHTPHIFGPNEVPPEVVNAPRTVPKPAGDVDRSNWPMLGNVPTRPHDFTPPATLDTAKSEMEGDRDEAEQMQHAYQEAPPVTPTGPLPPQP